ncbi:hypothetical protein CRG98_039242 [Punica granatum]|uniref:pectinesterase n=1 Tax=Punica granatum TaxID=22663 RepID=A0A2I0IAK6_PUNGR|nr:hypothetical protein CRG98_039242 [Punica granatum]
MASKIYSLVGTIIFIAILAGLANADDTTPIPANKSELQTWFEANMKPLDARKGELESKLEVAEAVPRVIRVRQDGSGDFRSISEVVHSIEADNTRRVIVSIGPGVYIEKVKIDRSKPFLTLHGVPNDMPLISSNGDCSAIRNSGHCHLDLGVRLLCSRQHRCHVAIWLINLWNTSPRPTGQIPGEQAVEIPHLNTELRTLGDGNSTVITTQARESKDEDSDYSLIHCSVTGTGSGTFLGRAWRPTPGIVAPAGWSNDNHPKRDSLVEFREYKNIGPGANPAGQAKFVKQMTDEEVRPFLSLGYIVASEWLLPPLQPRLV